MIIHHKSKCIEFEYVRVVAIVHIVSGIYTYIYIEVRTNVYKFIASFLPVVVIASGANWLLAKFCVNTEQKHKKIK